MKMFLAVLVAVAAVVAHAGCPNGCSSHGTCDTAEMCNCEAGFTGLDCSKRECPYGLSWISAADTGVVPNGLGLGGTHPYTECSSVGTCDYSSGTCDCDAGYSGRGCRIKACPNDCSGHGKCMSNYEVDGNHTALGGASFNTLFRDFLATRQCVCDRGFKGAACSERMCPRGDDPVTDCGTSYPGQNDDNANPAPTDTAAHEMIQRIYVRTVSPQNGETQFGTKDSSAVKHQCGSLTASPATAVDQCKTNAASCTGNFECDYKNAAHSYCTQETRWYANEAFCQLDGRTGTSAALGTDATDGANGDKMNTCKADIKIGTSILGDNTIFGGYIALKYTDMFGGVYKTRPILISNLCNEAQFIDIFGKDNGGTVAWTGSHDFYSPSADGQRDKQYGGLDDPDLMSASATDAPGTITSAHTAGSYEKGAGAAISGSILKAASSAYASSSAVYDQLRTTRLKYTADRIRQALQELPNFAIPSINVTNYYMDHPANTVGNPAVTTPAQKTMFTNVFDVTFTSKHTAGRQPLMECIYKQENACEGAFPRLANSGTVPFAATEGGKCNPADSTGFSSCNEKYFNTWGSLNVRSCTVEEVHPGTKVYEENAECSNRGICDTSSGVCNCFDGHTGEACQDQTVFF